MHIFKYFQPQAAAVFYSSLLQDVLCKNPYGSYNCELWCFPFHNEVTLIWITALLCGGNNDKIAGLLYRTYRRCDIFCGVYIGYLISCKLITVSVNLEVVSKTVGFFEC